LPSKREALSSNPSAITNKKKERKKERRKERKKERKIEKNGSVGFH
jgi:CelD/BcsL family acetyltransferase involved in cellulose biosynthesis